MILPDLRRTRRGAGQRCTPVPYPEPEMHSSRRTAECLSSTSHMPRTVMGRHLMEALPQASIEIALLTWAQLRSFLLAVRNIHRTQSFEQTPVEDNQDRCQHAHPPIQPGPCLRTRSILLIVVQGRTVSTIRRAQLPRSTGISHQQQPTVTISPWTISTLQE